jgi:GntR family transcriptional regulator
VRPFELEEALAERIAAGAVPAGSKLSDRGLAKEHGVGRLAARQVLGGLARRGLVELRPGHEAVVSRAKVEQALGVAGFTEQMERAGLEASARLLRAELIVAPPKVAAALGVDRNARVARIERLRFASKLAMTLEEAYVPEAIFPAFVELGLTGSLYALMRECYGRTPARAVERLEAVAAREREAELLRVSEGAPLMLVERTTYDEGGEAIEFSRDRHRGDRASFVVEVSTLVGTHA